MLSEEDFPALEPGFAPIGLLSFCDGEAICMGLMAGAEWYRVRGGGGCVAC